MAGSHEPNYDESLTPAWRLPDPLVFEDGRRVVSLADWEQRRQELLELFRQHVYGPYEVDRPAIASQTLCEGEVSLEGVPAVRRVTRLLFAREAPPVDVLSVLPMQASRSSGVPVFVGLNFAGNHSTLADPAIPFYAGWSRPREPLVDEQGRPTEASRGRMAHRWCISMLIKQGFGVVTAHGSDSYPDRPDGYALGLGKAGLGPPYAIGAWAWTLSRLLDHALTLTPKVDPNAVVVMGHSRLGKAALWAGANDPRFSAVISNASGCGGAALARRRFGERLLTTGWIKRALARR